MKLRFLTFAFIGSILFISCTKDDVEENLKDAVENAAGVLDDVSTFEDVTFSIDSSNDSNIAFSIAEGKVFSVNNISAAQLSTVELVSNSNQVFIAFDSPKESDLKGTKETKIQHTNVSLTKEGFEAITDSRILSEFEVKEDNESIQYTEAEGKVLLFETQEGRIGAILIKDVLRESFVVDIKVAK